MNLNKIAKILAVVISVVGVGLLMRIFIEGSENVENNADIQASVVDPLISFSLWIFYLTVGVTLVLSIWALVKNPAALKKTLMGLAALGVILVISHFVLSDNSQDVLDAAGNILEGGEAGSTTSKWVSTGIWYSMILGVIGGGLFVFDLVKGIIKS